MKWLRENSMRAEYFSLILIAVSFPFSIKINSIAIILFVVARLLSLRFIFNKKRVFFLALFGGYYVLHVIWLLNTTNFSSAFFNLEQKLSLIVFPLFILTMPFLSSGQVQNILKGFLFSCIAGSVICLGNGLYQYLSKSDTTYFFYHSLSEFIGISAIYFALYTCFCVFIVFHLWHKYLISGTFFQRLWVISLLLYLFVFLVLLSARMEMIALIIIMIIGIIYYSFTYGMLKKGIAIIAVMLLAGTAMVLLNPITRGKFKEAINFDDTINLEQDNSLGRDWGGQALRLAFWKCSFDVIKENWVIGVGTGDVQDELQKSYKKNNFSFAADYNRYNVHNQFLQTFIAFGILGLLYLLSFFLIPAIIAFKEKQFIYLAFILLFILANLTESMLNTHKGVVFYSFFNSLFAFHMLNKHEIKEV